MKLKKIIIATAVIIGGLSTTFIACKENVVAPSKDKVTESTSNIQTRLFVTQSTSLLTQSVQQFGVTNIDLVQESDTELIFKIRANPMDSYNGIDYYSLNGRVLKFSLQGNDIKMTYEDNKSIVYSPSNNDCQFIFGGNAISFSDDSFDDEVEQLMSKSIEDDFGWGLFLLQEIYQENLDRMPVPQERKSGGWDVINVGLGRSVAEARVKNEAGQFLLDNPNCRMIGSIDVSCLWDNHACIGTAHFECN